MSKKNKLYNTIILFLEENGFSYTNTASTAINLNFISYLKMYEILDIRAMTKLQKIYICFSENLQYLEVTNNNTLRFYFDLSGAKAEEKGIFSALILKLVLIHFLEIFSDERFWVEDSPEFYIDKQKSNIEKETLSFYILRPFIDKERQHILKLDCFEIYNYGFRFFNSKDAIIKSE